MAMCLMNCYETIYSSKEPSIHYGYIKNGCDKNLILNVKVKEIVK